MSGFEKRARFTLVECLLLVAHNFRAIIATGLKPGIAILKSLYYSHCKFLTLVWTWQSRVLHTVKNWPFQV